MINKITNLIPKNKLTNVFNRSPTNQDKKALIFGIGVIILLLIFFMIYRYRTLQRTKRLNPVFIPEGKIATKKLVIPGSKLPHPENGYDMSLTFWIYINSWKYRKGSWKHILHKGKDNTTNLSTPGIWLRPHINDIRFQITTRRRGYKRDNLYTLKDVPLKKWTQIAIVVQTNTIDIYVNGKIKRSENLYGLPVLNNGNLIVNNWSGFDGHISSITYSAKSLNPKELNNLYVLGPHRKSKLRRGINKVLNPIKKALGLDDKDSNGRSGSGSCGAMSKIPKGDSKQIKRGENELKRVTKKWKEAKAKREQLLRKLREMREKQNQDRENQINKSFNMIDTNKNRNISYQEFKKYRLN